MPSVMDAPELVDDVETHDLAIETLERREIRQTRPGFWRTLVHRITTYLTPTRHEWHTGACRVRRSFETPMDRFAREYPSVVPLAMI
jgi:hypothetical protein